MWIYQGYPGAILYRSEPIGASIPCGNGCAVTTAIENTRPVGRELAFTDIDVPGARNLVNQDGKVFAVMADGRLVLVSRTKSK